MKDTVGIILADRVQQRPNELLQFRNTSALPLAGKYRLIDFMLSGMTNSGIEKVGIVVSGNSASLNTHLGAGEAWDLRRRSQGLTLLYPSSSDGDAQRFAVITDFLKHSKQKLVLVGRGDIVFNTSFKPFLNFHRENRADISVMYHKLTDNSVLSKSDILEFDENGRLYSFEKNPRTPSSKNASMNIYLLERRLLLKLIDEAVSHGDRDLIMDCIVKKINDLRIFCYRFTNYSKRIDSVKSYFETNMDMMSEKVRAEIFMPERRIYTCPRNFAPTQYGDNAQISDCLIADGCRIDGELENCVVFGGVRIEKGVKAQNCILMEKSFVGNGGQLEYVVLDKECVVREGARLCGQQSFPVIIGKGAVI
ncbi:MAG: glucose-1-phosphate adenylyltransferase subunit GlgD [Clostridia bacterium]|nr:glucose-1-phosphate adenylyltransferase subunit GlgD [Clostridia bacterium]